jgi:hypothetical protein
MSTLMELAVVLVLCPAALAIWADARYPNLRPKELRRTTVHLGIGGLLAFVLMRPLLVGIAELARLGRPGGRYRRRVRRDHLLPHRVGLDRAPRRRGDAHRRLKV